MPEEHSDRAHKEARHQLEELLQELRVALPGVQMLFGFLLVAPFSEGFARLSSGQRLLFFGVFAATLLSSVALIAPSAFHRVHKGRELRVTTAVANTFALIGLAFLGLALVGSVALITAEVFGARVAVIAALVAALAILVAWLLVPLTSPSHKRTRPSLA